MLNFVFGQGQMPFGVNLSSAERTKLYDSLIDCRRMLPQIEQTGAMSMKATFKRAVPYANDAMNLPVADVDAAIPFYQQTLGFHVVSRDDSPHKSVVLRRDDVEIALAENGGDPTQEGCFFEVDDVESAFEEIKRKAPADSDLRVEKFDDTAFRVFFVIAPDGLCYMIGQRQDA